LIEKEGGGQIFEKIILAKFFDGHEVGTGWAQKISLGKFRIFEAY